jgi:hypothetical protein
MRIGVPKEIKNNEYRVGLTPASVEELVGAGHELFVETKAGEDIDCPDSAYEKAGATILPTEADVFKASDMIVKVKEPQPQEIALLEPDQDRLRVARRHRQRGPEGGAGHRRRSRARRSGTEARHPRDAENDEARLGPRRHRDRPGRLL